MILIYTLNSKWVTKWVTDTTRAKCSFAISYYILSRLYNNIISHGIYMEILGLLSGSIFKITDEILDTNYKPLLPYVEYIKTLCTIVMTIFLYKYPCSSIIYIRINTYMLAY